MTLDEIDAALFVVNAKVDALKEEGRALIRERDKVIAIAKIAAMPEAERAALLEVMRNS